MMFLLEFESTFASQNCDEERLYRSTDLSDTGAIDIFGMDIAMSLL